MFTNFLPDLPGLFACPTNTPTILVGVSFFVLLTAFAGAGDSANFLKISRFCVSVDVGIALYAAKVARVEKILRFAQNDTIQNETMQAFPSRGRWRGIAATDEVEKRAIFCI